MILACSFWGFTDVVPKSCTMTHGWNGSNEHLLRRCRGGGLETWSFERFEWKKTHAYCCIWKAKLPQHCLYVSSSHRPSPSLPSPCLHCRLVYLFLCFAFASYWLSCPWQSSNKLVCDVHGWKEDSKRLDRSIKVPLVFHFKAAQTLLCECMSVTVWLSVLSF